MKSSLSFAGAAAATLLLLQQVPLDLVIRFFLACSHAREDRDEIVRGSTHVRGATFFLPSNGRSIEECVLELRVRKDWCVSWQPVGELVGEDEI